VSDNNIAFYRKSRGLSQTELAERIGTTLNMLGKLERGDRTLDTDWLQRIGKALDVEPRDLIGGDPIAPKPHHPSASDDDVVEITALDLSLSMGPGTLIEDFIESEPVKMGLSLVQSITRTPTDRLRLVKGIGDSMEPTLRTGDRVMVDINERALSRINGIYWIDHLGTHGIKRLRVAGKRRVMVISDNPHVPDFEVDAEDLRIEGRVIWYAREL
jgi:transcriptional regulator with XRE-family HTH domain